MVSYRKVAAQLQEEDEEETRKLLGPQHEDLRICAKRTGWTLSPLPGHHFRRSTQSRVLFVACFMNLHLRWSHAPSYLEGHRNEITGVGPRWAICRYPGASKMGRVG